MTAAPPSGRKFAAGKSGNPGGRPKGSIEVRDLARKHTAAAIKRLVEIMEKGQSEPAMVMAANSLLDRGWGKSIAVNQHEGKDGGPIVIKIEGDSTRL